MINKKAAAVAAAIVMAFSAFPVSPIAAETTYYSASSTDSQTDAATLSDSSSQSDSSSYDNPSSMPEDPTGDDDLSSSEVELINISSAKISSIADQEYTAKQITPNFTVTLNGVTLTKDVDYKATYTSNVNVGKATITVTGIGAYTGSVKTYFNIVMPVQAAVKTISAADITTSSYTITWSASSKATGYELYRYNVSTQKWDLLTSANVRSFKVTRLKAAQDNHYCVRAYRKIGTNTIYSEYTRLFAGTKPAKVTGLKIADATTSGYTIKWDAVSGAAKYQVYLYDAKTKKYNLYKTVTTNSATVTGRTPGQKNTFKVRAVHTVDGASLAGTCGKAQFTSKPGQVTGFACERTGKGSITFSWNAVANANEYQLFYSTQKNGTYTLFRTVSGSKTSVKTGLMPTGKKLYFKMRAVSQIGSCRLAGQCSTKIRGMAFVNKNINTILNGYSNSYSVKQVNAQGYSISSYNSGRLYNALTSLGGSAGYILYDIDSGSAVAYNANSYFGTASTVKMPYVLYCLREMEDGDPGMDTLLTYLPSDHSDGSSWIKYQPYYTKYTIKRVIELIGDYSDNCGYYMMQDYFGYDGYNRFISGLGCTPWINSSVRWGYVSACDSAREWNNMWDYLRNGRYASFARDVFSTSCAANIRDQLGNRYTVYEKSGWTESLYNETALVRAEHPYIVICLSTVTSAQRMRNVAEISEAIHNEMWNYYNS